ncbi:MAG: hypothetical protein V4686_01945 [Patescibacteria group bacterium]
MSILAYVYRPVRYKNTLFLDTNFVIGTKTQPSDGRYRKLFTYRRKKIVSEFIKNEIDEKLLNDRHYLLTKEKFETLSFNDLYVEREGICPVYHNFISVMHNPANISSEDFLIQSYFSKIIKGEKTTTEEDAIYKRCMQRLAGNCNQKNNILGNLKTDFEKVMDEAHLKSMKKRKQSLSGKNKNYANDLRNLSIIFLYSLMHKENVTFVTSDSDAVEYFFDWTSSITQQWVFNTRCLLILAENNSEKMNKLFKRNLKAIHFEPKEFIRYLNGSLQRTYSNKTKFFSPRLTIKYWDTKREKYFDFSINIDYGFRELILNCHGALNCPTAKNDTMGNFIGYHYWWPPEEDNHQKSLKILPLLKPLYRSSENFSPEEHDRICRYRLDDKSNNLNNFSWFE